MATKYHITNIAEAEQALLPYVPLVSQLTGKDTTLDRIRPLMALLDNPQDKLRVIHIAGTSGKTSTSYYIAALLRATGKAVGLTVSPHVDSITERVQLNGVPLDEATFCSELAEYLEYISGLAEPPSYFELMYAFAIWVFERAHVDYAVIETGMGGLYDATNIVSREDKVCVITDIGFDHMHILGHTLPEIAAQKIGIVHEHNPVIMYEQNDSIMPVIYRWTEAHHALLHITSEPAERTAYAEDISKMAAYQQRNWLLAHAVYEFVQRRDRLPRLSQEALRTTQELQVPARMDTWQVQGKTVIMDGAHNGQKMAAFIDSFTKCYPGITPAILLAFKQGKEFEAVAKMLAPLAASVIVTTFATSQDLPVTAIDPEEIVAAFTASGAKHVQAIPNRKAALEALLRSPEPIVIITGSFYLLSQIRSDILTS